MRSIAFATALAVLAATVARAEEPGSEPAAALERGRKEVLAGAIITGLAVVGLAVSFSFMALASTCVRAEPDSECGIGWAISSFGVAMAAIAETHIGIPLLATGIVRMRDARLRLAPTVSAHGGGLALGFTF